MREHLDDFLALAFNLSDFDRVTAEHDALVKRPPTDRMITASRGCQFKQHSVAEALLHFTGEELIGGHRAHPNAEACTSVYFSLNPPPQVA
ncbi:hypothetical protein [Pseudomonas saponiphila]|uniref:hypothetical protein n=1 Tax=Pseudomonas saponiphila TaxID=556534 RepID=UPI002240572B|nr:hypothetical protein [Pseudomonas saponiphila]